MKKLTVMALAMASLMFAGCASTPGGSEAATDASLRNPVGGTIAQYTNPLTAKPEWQIVFADGNACQKFVGLFNSKPDVLKYAVDCWESADSASASLPTKLKLADGKVLEAEAPTAKANTCSAAVATLADVGIKAVDQCPAQPAAPAK